VVRARSNVEAEVFTSQCGASTSVPLYVNGQRTFVVGLEKQVSRVRYRKRVQTVLGSPQSVFPSLTRAT
jgi:hypothetical protein